MTKRKPAKAKAVVVRKWKRKDFTHGKGFSTKGAAEREMIRGFVGARGPQKAPTKELISIRLSREVVEGLRATGRGWQGRVDVALREWLEKKRK